MADISRSEALALINQQNLSEIFQQATQTSAALKTFRTVRMSAKQARMPVIDALPSAGFVSGEDTTDSNATKPTSQQTWRSKTLEVEEIAVIVVIPENVFDDSSFNVWDEVRPRIAESVGAVLDGAVFFGTNKPSSWPNSLEDGARAAGNLVSLATIQGGTAPKNDLAEAINQTIGAVEADGYDVNVAYAKRSLRMSLRGLRATTGEPLYLDNFKSDGSTLTGANAQIMGAELYYVTNGSWVAAVASPAGGANMIVGDRNMAILGLRQDMTFKFLDQATVGGVSLAERDLVALRCKMRVAFQVADPTTIEGGSSAYPFAVLGA